MNIEWARNVSTTQETFAPFVSTHNEVPTKKKNHISKLSSPIDSTKNSTFGYRLCEADRLYLRMTSRLGESENHRFLFFVHNQESNQTQGKKVH